MQSRLPRFTRSSLVAPFQFTVRDREIICLVHQHRFLRSSHITSLLHGSKQQVLRRLKLLYHHGYLERPRAQIDYYYQGGSRQIVYGLGIKAASLLTQNAGFQCPRVSWSEKNRPVGRMFLEHALLVSDVMVIIEQACRKAGIRLLPERDLVPETARPLQWKVSVNNRKLGVIPDRAFGLEFSDRNGKANRIVFFLEADRGTMPVIRDNLSQTSFHRKMLAYEATWSQNIHGLRFGFHRFRVLTVTKSVGRLKSLLKACSTLKSGQGLFLFTDWPALERSVDPLSSIWRNAKDEAEDLLN